MNTLETSAQPTDIASPSPAQVIPSPTEIETPPTLRENYKITRELGHGAQGCVYEATRLSDGTRVAIKQLRIQSVRNWKDYDLFHRESEVLSTLDYKGVAKYYESIEALEDNPPAAYIVQEFIEGQSLSTMIKAGYRFTITQIFELSCQLLDLLDQLHSHNPPVIHRDIKPSNIILKPMGPHQFQLYLIDFGAVANPQVKGGGSTVAGTYGYMPPEQLTGRPCPASDTYSLAAMIAGLLGGVSPADMEYVVFRLIIDPYLENVPRPVVRTLQLMLEPDPKKRLSDINKLRPLFMAFAKEQFSLSSLPDEHSRILVKNNTLSNKEINRRLSKVSQYNQPGNMDLWMALPETTPRKVPKAYNYITLGDRLKLLLSNVPYFVYDKLDDYLDLYFLPGKILTFVYIALIITFFEVILPKCQTAGFLIPIYIISFILFILIPFIILMNFIHTKFYYKHYNYFFSIRYQREIKEFISDSQKTIATIVDVTYIPPVSSVTRFEISDQPHSDHTVDEQYYYYYDLTHYSEESPRFRIRYKFNPPDDSLQEDLIHEIYTNIDYRNILKPGMPLPILYQVGGYDNTCVTSMPYPLPIAGCRPTRKDAFMNTTYNGQQH